MITLQCSPADIYFQRTKKGISVYKTSFRVSLLVIMLMLPWTAIYAAGLGKLMLNSALGQPLSAEIDIVITNRDEVSSLNASIAPREAFAQAGINYESNFSAFKISIESRTNGNPYIKLTSPQAVNDPFLNILVELNWNSGRILREYAVLLDPVEVNAQNIAVPGVSAAPVVPATKKETKRSSDVKKDRPGKNSSKSVSRAANQTRDIYGPVIRGDNLSSIARQVLPAGVDLNQMLVALYRANRDAFIANNMNLLKVGAILKIPEKSEVAAIDTSTARAEIRMQVEDWHNYQGKIAAIAGESPTHANIRQSDQGKITTSIDKKSVSTRESPKEVLRLSSGTQAINKNGQIPESALVDRLRMMEEDAIARNLALQEANQRVAMLEKSIENLKQLLELKDSVLAQAQIKAGSVSNVETNAERQPVKTTNSLPENNFKTDTDALQVPEQKTPIAQLANETAIKDKEVKPLPAQETEDQSLTDQIFGNIEYIGAALISLLLIILLILKKRRSQLKEEVDIDERNANFSSAMQSRMTSTAAAQTIPITGTNHSFSEHEKDDLTYENMNAYPEAGGHDESFDRDSADYEEHTEQIEKSELETESIAELPDENDGLADDSKLNNQAIDLNLEEDFEENYNQSIDSKKNHDATDFVNETDFDLTDEANGVKQNLAIEHADYDAKEKVELSEKSENLQETMNASDFELEIDFDDPKHPLDPVNSENIATEKDNVIEFAHSDIDLTEEEISSEIEISKINAESKSTDHDFDAPELMDESLDSVQHQELAGNAMKSASGLPELGLDNINLDIEDSNSADKISETSDLNDESEQWQEVETKLDLAKAYQEMDDKEGAKEMLEEVIRDGNAKQKKAARKLLKSL